MKVTWYIVNEASPAPVVERADSYFRDADAAIYHWRQLLADGWHAAVMSVLPQVSGPAAPTGTFGAYASHADLP